MDYSEKRDFQRMDLDCSLEYQLENDQIIRQGVVINLSAKGILFIARNAIASGDRVTIILTPVNNITPPMSAETVVARCEKQSESEYQIAAEIVQIQ